MPGFDAEYYLRCAAEDALCSHDDRGVDDRARALVAAGAIERAEAKAVIDSYARARVLRGYDHRHFPPSPARQPDAHRVCAAARVIDQPWGTVRLRYVALAANRTEVAAVVDLKPGGPPPPSGRPSRGGHARAHFHGGPPSVHIGDDHRRSVQAEFGGSGSDEQWRGTWSTNSGLTLDTAWIELFGERVTLTDISVPATVHVERFDTDRGAESIGTRAERHLEHRLEALNPWRGETHGIDEAIETLVACGALTPAAPIIPQVRAIAEALTMGASGQVRGVPPRWQSILHPPRRRSAPDRSMLVGVTTPEFDGQFLSIMTIEVTDDVFEFDFQGTGSLTQNSRHSSFDDVLVTFTATDDRGNHYLGRLHSHGRSGDELEGTVKFTPALDPDATELDLIFSAERSRATIRLPLHWEQTS